MVFCLQLRYKSQLSSRVCCWVDSGFRSADCFPGYWNASTVWADPYKSLLNLSIPFSRIMRLTIRGDALYRQDAKIDYTQFSLSLLLPSVLLLVLKATIVKNLVTIMSMVTRILIFRSVVA